MIAARINGVGDPDSDPGRRPPRAVIGADGGTPARSRSRSRRQGRGAGRVQRQLPPDETEPIRPDWSPTARTPHGV